MAKKLSGKKKRAPSKWAKLRFTNDQGVEFEEYIPPINSEFTDWWRWAHVKARKKFNKDIYYWHIRQSFNPKFRKRLDVAFINHVLIIHAQQPTDPIESRHFQRARKLYGQEIKYVVGELSKDRSTKWGDDGPRKGHPDVYKYTDRWMDKNYDSKFKLLYHGISWDEYCVLIARTYTPAKQ